tara:strand:+ start:5879 stop:6085 length:207 start_codon:yes stop_codon:yes gene_type:complete
MHKTFNLCASTPVTIVQINYIPKPTVTIYITNVSFQTFVSIFIAMTHLIDAFNFCNAMRRINRVTNFN